MSPAGWLPRNRDQLGAQRPQSSMGLIYFLSTEDNEATVKILTIWSKLRLYIQFQVEVMYSFEDRNDSTNEPSGCTEILC